MRLLLPFFILFVLFWLMPLIGGVELSLRSNELVGEGEWAGLQNYRELLGDERFGKAIRNTFKYTAASIVLIIPLALVLAQLLQRCRPRLKPFFSFTLLLPGLTPPAVLALLFLLVFHGREGFLNRFLVTPFGFDPINWLKDPSWILPALVLQSVWRWTGLMAFFFLAAMEGIPRHFREAAQLETGNHWRIFWSVTIPMLRHVILFAAVYLVVDAFALFSGAYVLLGGSGGTGDAGLLLVNYTYQTAFTFGQFGTAAAMSLMLVPVMVLLLGLCFLIPRRQHA